METKRFLPERLVEARKRLNWSQRALARSAGVSQALVAELERGKHPPSAGALSKLVAALHLSESFFLEDESA